MTNGSEHIAEACRPKPEKVFGTAIRARQAYMRVHMAEPAAFGMNRATRDRLVQEHFPDEEIPEPIPDQPDFMLGRPIVLDESIPVDEVRALHVHCCPVPTCVWCTGRSIHEILSQQLLYGHYHLCATHTLTDQEKADAG